jgi:hypothetical protein
MADNTILVANTTLAAEEFDGETVLIDVAQGLYFCLRGAATEVWRAFAEQRKINEVVETLCAQLAGADRTSLEVAVSSMREHALLVPAPDGQPVTTEKYVAACVPFAPPVVEVFNDLADLIAIDPVHEVDTSAGWPMRPGNFPEVS